MKAKTAAQRPKKSIEAIAVSALPEPLYFRSAIVAGPGPGVTSAGH